MSSEQIVAHSESIATLVTNLGGKLKSLATSVQSQIDKAVEMILAQRKSMEEFAEAESRAMRHTSEEMIQVPF